MSKGIRNAILKKLKVKKQKKTNDVELFFVDKLKRSHRVDYSAMAKAHKAKKSKYVIDGVTNMYQKKIFFVKKHFFWKI